METLVTEQGGQVPSLKPTHETFLGKSIVIYGPSGTGKSIAIRDIMDQYLRGHIDQVLVISPSETTNHSFEGFVSPVMIRSDFLKEPAAANAGGRRKRLTPAEQLAARIEFLEDFWSRCEMLMACHTKAATDLDSIRALFARLPGDARERGTRDLESLAAKKADAAHRIGQLRALSSEQRREHLGRLDAGILKSTVAVYRKYIGASYHTLWDSDLTAAERGCLQYLFTKPGVLLIFDDCSALLKKALQNSEVFTNLFYRGRHAGITTIFALQDDTNLDTDFRKNAFVSVFTTATVSETNFNRACNGYSREVKKSIGAINAAVFTNPTRKLIYLREDPQQRYFYHWTFDKRQPRPFGSEAFIELCRSLENSSGQLDQQNPYFAKFRTQAAT